MPRQAVAVLFGSLLALALSNAAHAQSGTAQVGEAPVNQAAPLTSSKLWIVGGGGFSMARAGCADCDRAGVFTNSIGLFFDIGGRVSPRVDVGIETMFVSGRVETQAPLRTTFVLGISQFRPWVDRGLYLRAGMGLGWVGNGITGPIGELSPPYSTNALGVTYGLGWVFKQERRWTAQVAFSHHVAAIGELVTESGLTIRNVVGNYWTSGMAIVFR